MTSALPWDRFSPTEAQPVTQPEPPAPVQPLPRQPAPVPTPQRPAPNITSTELARAELGDVLEQLWPDIKDLLAGYARDTWTGIRKGETVDVLHPTITATDVSGRELVVADARNRSWRTFLQGLIFDLLAGLAAAIAVLAGADPFVKETWVAFGILVLKTFVSAGISYLMRLRATPTVRTKGPEVALMPLPRPVVNEETNERMTA